MASSSSTSSSRRMSYQVFLSFRGADTRHNFTSHLLEALKESGVNVFFDEEKLKKGEDVAPTLSAAIAATKISVIILSEDYAASNSCLDELSDIMELKETKGHIVRPIFYHVDPFDVENVDGSFEKSFQDHKNDSRRSAEEVERWETAFREVGKLGGCVIKGGQDDRPETKYISDIVDSVILGLTKHQIFLSFGETTRLNFTNHLHKALERRGLNVFISKGTLEEKSQAIADSDISIIIFCDGYVSSESCLAEVSEIMKHRETRKQIVLPIFYQVKTSYVRRKIPVFGRDRNIKGWSLNGENRDRSDAHYIKDVAEVVIANLKSKCRSVSGGKFGIYDHKEGILRLVEKEGTRVIGLWGPGGIGKTTLAEAVYNEISPYFEAHWFVQNVREKIEKKGIEFLKNQLLSKLFNSETCVGTPTVGSSVTKDRMKNTKALVVLDDVSSFQHIDGMDLNFLADGSKIIVTSRDRQVIARADKIHEVKRLSTDHSFQLFSTFAFKQSEPAAEFVTVSSRFLRYAQGSPLALKVLGSMLYNKPIEVWKSEAAKLGEYSKPEILQVLERSYRGLDELEKKIFLDIAIFFKGEQDLNEYVEAFLSSCYGGGYLCGISSLVDKCFLEIRTSYDYEEEPYQYFDMHDMLEEMGKHIETKSYPGNRRRLWKLEDVTGLLKYNQGANSIEGITGENDLRRLRLTGLPKMPKLRFFYINSSTSVDQEIAVDIEVLSDELRYLHWWFYPFESLSSTFNPVNLVVVKLYYGKMKRLWNGDQVPLNLRKLDVGWCKKLEEIPNLSGATKLKILNCYYCLSLVKVAGLENLASLENLNFSGCTNLVKIPSLSGATKLKILDCEDCTSLVELPSLNHLTSLEKLDLCSCKSLKKYPELPNNLSDLYLSHSGIEVSASIEHLIGLKSLIMSWSEVKKVSINFSKCESLQVLEMSSSNHLEILPQLPPNLIRLDAYDCKSLTEVSFTVEDPNLTQLDLLCGTGNIFYDFSDCYSLKPESVNNIEEYAIHKIKYLAMGRISGLYRHSKKLLCCLPKKEISANKFEFQSESSSLTFEIDKNMCNPSGNLAFAICLVVDVTWLEECIVVGVVCDYRLTALTAAGRDECGSHIYHLDNISERDYTGNYMLILFSDNFIFKGEYKEASFTFHFATADLDSEEVHEDSATEEDLDTEEVHEDSATEEDLDTEEVHEDSATEEDLDTEEVHEDSATEEDLDTDANLELELGSSSIMVKKCGVHVFPVDLRGFQCSDKMRRLEYQDARSEKIHEDSATEEDSSIVMRPSPKRRISDDGEEGVEEGPKRLK